VHEFCQALPAEPGSKKRLRRLMRKADRKAAKRLTGAIAVGEPTLLHRARKAAKRARYAGELVQPFGGRRASEQAARNEHLQELLGEHQDSLVSAELLKRLATIAGTTPGENGFSYGVLYQRQLDRAAELRRRVVGGG
jgi:CHAD domain-containing protein